MGEGGNINQFVLACGPYAQTLEKTRGVMGEFVNPKYADSSKTTFKKPARLECMMQDYPKVLGAAVLSCGDLLVCTAPHSVGRVPGLVAWLCDKLEDSQLGLAEGWAERELAVVQNSALYSLQRLLEAFSGFLSPLLARMVGLACRLSGCQLTAARANPLLSALAAGTPAHTTLSLAGQLLDSSLTGPSASLTLPPLLNFPHLPSFLPYLLIYVRC